MDLLGRRMTLPAEFRGSCVQCECFLLVRSEFFIVLEAGSQPNSRTGK